MKRSRIFTAYIAFVMLAVLAFASDQNATVRFDATLEKDLHAKRVKVGDTITARVKSEVALKDGTKIPKNSKLVGHVTEVKKSEGDGPSRIGVLFDKLKLDKNEEKPISVTLISVAPPEAHRAVNQMAAQSGMTGAGRVSAMSSQTGRGSNAESSENVLKSGVGGNTGGGSDPELSPGVSTIEGVMLSYKASGPDTVLENKKDHVYVQRWSRMLFQVN